ncbi:response regulator [Algoriphagus halophytocola]|uniref:Response regulator n=1 Tax=Algoriphagus halophytocola TaxID=2991499 RepID=A0ABY6MJQ1_9BACT|nr:MULTISPECIES: response regulator [unclassified Algoriphagus]UZD24006.1 response regulator [Algoriphagus sp. TR-M5]WBL41378.1 response regulator [Algoriphagus sp. TR-M9]
MSNSPKILVAEDSSVIINLTKSILAFENFEIKSARNGKQVLEQLEKDDIDLILMDINMPVMDGVSCTQAIRKLEDPVKSNLPIIAISGNLKNYTLDEFRNLGFSDFLQKPLDYDQVLALVKKHLS